MDGQWNASIITPIDEGSAPIATNGGLKKNEDLELEVSVDNETIVINGEGELQAVGGGAEYYAGEGININNENTISITETVRDGAALGATSVQPHDLASYATSAEVTAGLATKQDTISDLATIRSGAALGGTAVQPAALNDYATTSALTSGLATKQDTLTAGSNITISNGTISAVDTTYTAGANITIENGVISATDGDTRYSAGNGIDIDSNNEISVDTTVIATKTDLASKQDTISDLATIRSGAALGATAVQPGSLATVATTGAYSDLSGTPTIPTVDQTYNASSANAQSGVAVAQAIAAIPAPQVSGVVEEFDWSTVSYSDISTCLTNGNTPVILYDRFNDGQVQRAYLQQSATYSSGTTYYFCTPVSVGALDTSSQSGTVTRLTITSDTKTVDYNEPVNVKFTVDSTLNLTQPSQYSTDLVLSVVDPVPSHTSTESGKVLGVDANGALEWATPATVTVDQTYNASSANAQSGTAVAGALASYTPTASLATVATTGSYNDLSGKPTIPTVPDTKPVVAGSNVTITENANDITISATDTTYSAGTGISISSGTISNSDPLPSHTSTESGKVLGVDSNGDLGWVNQSGGSSYVAGNGINIANDTISVDTTVVATQSDLSNYTPTANLATVATTGAYSDLSGTPTIPTVDQTYDASSANAQSGVAVAGALATKQDVISDLSTIRSGAALGSTAVQPSSLATVATSGSYHDLSNTPSIPVIGTITINDPEPQSPSGGDNPPDTDDDPIGDDPYSEEIG